MIISRKFIYKIYKASRALRSLCIILFFKMKSVCCNKLCRSITSCCVSQSMWKKCRGVLFESDTVKLVKLNVPSRKVCWVYDWFWCINGVKCITCSVPDFHCQIYAISSSPGERSSWILHRSQIAGNRIDFFTLFFLKSVKSRVAVDEWFCGDEMLLRNIRHMCYAQFFMISMWLLGKFPFKNSIDPGRESTGDQNQIVCSGKAYISGSHRLSQSGCSLIGRLQYISQWATLYVLYEDTPSHRC